MTYDQVTQLIRDGLPPQAGTPELVETHISWVIIGNDYAYKIKKPIQYSFLDFSTLEKRKHFLQEELRLNWRLTFNVYLGIDRVVQTPDGVQLGGDGEVIDYALRMRTLDRSKQMDRLIGEDRVTRADLVSLANRLIRFHRRTQVVMDAKPMDVANRFDDLDKEIPFVSEALGDQSAALIKEALKKSTLYMRTHEAYLNDRLKGGWYRDGHGDLHTRNIFLLPEPVIFDCLEFNSAYRQIDLLNELAFLCMDFEAFGRADLASQFITIYSQTYPLPLTHAELKLFTYYKGYRANVRAKVNSLRAQTAADVSDHNRALTEVTKYLGLMSQYLKELD